MRRIGLAVVLALSVVLAPLTDEAQPAGKVYRIGFLRAGPYGRNGCRAIQHRGPAARGLELISRGFPLVTSADDETALRASFLYDALYASIKDSEV